MGISTLESESIQYDGRDWETKHRQRAKEVAAQKRDGIYSPPAGTPAQPDAADDADDEDSIAGAGQ
jgi:hypothetical protein